MFPHLEGSLVINMCGGYVQSVTVLRDGKLGQGNKCRRDVVPALLLINVYCGWNSHTRWFKKTRFDWHRHKEESKKIMYIIALISDQWRNKLSNWVSEDGMDCLKNTPGRFKELHAHQQGSPYQQILCAQTREEEYYNRVWGTIMLIILWGLQLKWQFQRLELYRSKILEVILDCVRVMKRKGVGKCRMRYSYS